MIKKLPLIIASITIFSLSSCKVEKLVTDNNQISQKIQESTDSLNFKTDQIIKQNIPPELKKLKIVSLNDFYFGNIIKEEAVNKKGSWLKIKLTEEIKLNEQDVILKEKSGWFSFHSPETIYLIDLDNNTIINNSIITNRSIETFNSDLKISTTKPDLLNNKDIDLLLSKSSLNFNGLKFSNKRFDYSNFSIGSFYGTDFLNCNLNYVYGIRNSINEGVDFKNTKISGINALNNNLLFKNWKFIDSQFSNTSINKSTFTDCILSNDVDGLVSFLNVTIQNSKFINSDKNSYFKNVSTFNSKYINNSFTNITSYNSYFYNTELKGCNFYGGEWNNSAFVNIGLSNKILGGSFIDLKINRGTFSNIIIDVFGLVQPIFSNVIIKESNFSNSNINVEFTNGFKITGDFSSVDFKKSSFDRGTFGEDSSGSLMKIQNSDFAECTFRENVTFIKCDLTGATFPDNRINITFIDCVGVN